VSEASGSDSNGGTSFGDAYKTLAVALAAVDTSHRQVNIVNDGDHVWTVSTTATIIPAVAGTSYSDPGVLIQGTDSDGNEAFATIKASGADNARHFGRFRDASGAKYCIVQNLIFDAQDKTTDANDYHAVQVDGTAQGFVKVRYCQLIAGATGSTSTGERYLYSHRASFTSTTDQGGVEYCYIQNSKRPYSTGLGQVQFRFYWDHNVYIFDAQVALSTNAFPIGLLPANTNNIISITHNTVYIDTGSGVPVAPVVATVPSSTDIGTLHVHSNLLWMDTTNSSMASWMQGSPSYLTVTNAGTIGYNGLVYGPNVDGTESLPAGVYGVPWDPDDIDSPEGTEVYSTDNLTYTTTAATVFTDPASTVGWVLPNGLSVTLLKNLRPLLYKTASLAGTPVGALRAAADNGTGDTSGTASEINGIFDYHYSNNNGGARHVIICASNNIYTDTGNHTPKSRYYDLKYPAKYTFTAMNELLVICSTHDKQRPLSFNSATKEIKLLDGTAPNMSYAVEHFSRIIGAGIQEAPSYIYGSKILDPEQWAFGSFDDDPIRLGITVDDRQRITGLSSAHFGQLYVFKEHSISRISGSWANATDVARTTISSTRGCIAHHTITAVANDVFFWSDQGCHSVIATDKFGDIETKDVSFDIRKAYRRIVDPVYMHKAFSVNYTSMDLYVTWFQSKGGTGVDTAFVYHYGIGEWTIWNLPAQCATVSISDNLDPKILTGSSDGRINEWPGTTYHSSCTMGLGGLTGESPLLIKNYEELNLYIRAHGGTRKGEATLEFLTDDDQHGTKQTVEFPLRGHSDPLGHFKLGVSKLDREDNIVVVPVDFEGGKGRAAKIQLSQNDANVALEVIGYVVKTTRKGQ